LTKPEAPDWVTLFPGLTEDEKDADEDLEVSFITPRTAFALWVGLQVLADHASDDIARFGDAPVTEDGRWMFFDRLPRIAWSQPASWRRQFARCFDDLCAELVQGEEPRPRNTAEEVALHLAMQYGATCADDMEQFDHLPEHPDDLDEDLFHEMLYADTDFLYFWEPNMDGFEAPDTEINKAAGIGDKRPANWFETFGGSEERAPNRGFQR